MFTAKTDLHSANRRDYVACYSLNVLLLIGSIVSLLIWRVTILLMIAIWIGLSSASSVDDKIVRSASTPILLYRPPAVASEA